MCARAKGRAFQRRALRGRRPNDQKSNVYVAVGRFGSNQGGGGLKPLALVPWLAGRGYTCQKHKSTCARLWRRACLLRRGSID